MKAMISVVLASVVMSTAALPASAAVTTSTRTLASSDQLSKLKSKQAPTLAPSTALVRSCKDDWYKRSLIEMFTCGLSGQGWTN